MDAARHWAGGEIDQEEVDQEYLAALQGFGAPAELVDVEQQRVADDAAPFEVFEDNWQTVQVFLALQTQWDKTVVAGETFAVIYSGIRYSAFPAAMVIAGAPRSARREIYLGVQLMEYTAIPFLNRGREGASDGE